MMAPSRGPQDTQHEARRRRSISSSNSSHGSSATDPEPSRRPRRDSEALERHLTHVVDVDDASRLMECSQIQRQLRFQYLVRRYISQILYGCNNAYCTTPTCLTCNKRLVYRPFRAPTQLTARALAHFLASQNNPYNGLCPHQPSISPDSLEIQGVNGIEVRQGASGIAQLCNVFPIARPRSQSPIDSYKQALGRPSASTSLDVVDSMQQKHENDEFAKVLASVNERRQARKDLKSLGQNLFDTVTVIYSYSKQIPSPWSVFASLRSSPSPRQKVMGTDPNRDSITETALERDADLPNAAFTEQINSYTILPHVNETRTPIETAPQHSPRNLKTAFVDSEALGNSQRIHKIRHHLGDSVSNGHSPLKTHGPTSLDGTLESSGSYIPAMKKKMLSLDVYSRSRTDPAVLTPLGATRDDRSKKLGETSEPVLPVASHLNCEIMGQLKGEICHNRSEQSSDSNFVVDYSTDRRFRPTKPFVNRSMFFTLSDPETLLKSFRDDDNEAYKNSPLPHLNSTRLKDAFQDWSRLNGALVFDSLWIAVEALFRPPPELDVHKSPHLKSSRKTTMNGAFGRPSAPETSETTSGRYLDDGEAAHIVMICIHALTSSVSLGWSHTWVQLRKFRSWGIILPDAPPHKDFTDAHADPWLNIIDELEYEPAIRLADRLVRGIGARICFEQILATLGHREHNPDDLNHPIVDSRLMEILVKHLGEVERLELARKKKLNSNFNYNEDPGWTVTATFMEWLRTIIIKKWDGKADVNRWSSVGAAITLLNTFYVNRNLLNLRTHMFYMPHLNERLDPVNEPAEFLRRNYHPNSFHLFQYPCLFPPDCLVAYFRTINFTNMFKNYERTERTVQLRRELEPFLHEPYWGQIRARLKVTLSDYLVLDVRRESALKDTLDQLWGQERRLFLKPLKVKMGMQEGEVGLDQGGVTYEFFRVVLKEAFKPDNGMFTVDSQTRMTWFQPASLEPDWKFEMLGILFSLAVYNGITLPVTFPRAMYHILLSADHPCFDSTYPSTTDFIRDGWPTLAKSLDELLAWDDGDVADVFMRGYSFSFEAFGRMFEVDMHAFDKPPSGEPAPWPADYEGTFGEPTLGPFGPIWHPNTQRPDLNSPAWERPRATPTESIEEAPGGSEVESVEEAPLVTNANREQFVPDYIFWLTFKSVAPQLLAFRNGFRACLHPKSLCLFDPISLKALVEGTQEVSISALKPATRYEEGYSASHTTIVDFWSVVEKYGQEERKQLLEFVTASERVPITGFESMNFVIVRNGGDTEYLPTSSTCFGKLMLPQYASREKLKRKLDLAIQNSTGFGVV